MNKFIDSFDKILLLSFYYTSVHSGTVLIFLGKNTCPNFSTGWQYYSTIDGYQIIITFDYAL